MEDNINDLAIDMQQAIANNITEFTSDINYLFFDKTNMKKIYLLSGFQELTIRHNKERIFLNCTLAQNMLKMITDEDMEKIKEGSIQTQIATALKEEGNIKGTFINKSILENLEEKEYTYRKATKNEKLKIAALKGVLYNLLKIDFTIKNSECFLSLETEIDNITLNENQLLTLLHIIELFFDNFLISPVYKDEESEEISGIRLFLGISLREEDEE